MNDNILEAIQILEDEISEKQEEITNIKEKINMLNSFNVDEKLTEDIYHELCETDLRNTDFLGKLIENTIPELVFEKRSPNYFHYTVKDNKDIQIRIPSYSLKEIEIVFPYYYRKLNKIEEDSLYLMSMENRNSKIERLEKYLNNKNFKYFIGSVFMQNRKIRKRLNSLIKEREEFKNSCENRYNTHNEKRANQQIIIKKYAEIFLKWTNKVKVFSSFTSPYMCITKENDKIIFEEY